MKKAIITCAIAVCAALTPSCSSCANLAYYNVVGQHARVLTGTVTAVSPTRIAASKEDKELGQTVGGLVGFGAGQLLGGGRGRVASAYGFSALGTLAGHVAASQLGQKDGQHIIVKTSSGRTYSVDQPVFCGIGHISVGTHGRLELGNGTSRFTPDGY